MPVADKFFLIYNSLDLGGVQRKIVDVVNYIYSRKLQGQLEPHVIIRHRGKFSFEKELVSGFDKIHLTPKYVSFRNRRVPYLVFILYQALKLKPKVIMVFLLGPAVQTIVAVKLLSRLKASVIISQDNVLSLEKPQWYEKLLARVFYPMADVIVVQTDYAKRDLVENYSIDEKKIRVMANWTLMRIGVTEKKTRDCDLIYCGRFYPQKNLRQLIIVADELGKKLPKLSVKLIGDGIERSGLEQEIKTRKLSDTVSLLPPTNKVKERLITSKLLVLTSKHEGQPMILLEAMALGVVPVVMNFPGVEEYLANKVTGVVCESRKEMTQEIEKLLRNTRLRKKLARAAKEDVRKRFGVDKVRSQVELISSLVRR